MKNAYKSDAAVGGVSDRSQRQRFWSTDPRVRGIVENVADGVIGIDHRGAIELFNPVAERLFGYSSDDVIGRNVKMLMPDSYAQHHDQYLSQYLDTGVRSIIGAGREVTGQRRDGSTFPMYLSVGELDLPGHHGFIGIVHDLSAQKAAEEELARASLFMQSIIDAMPSVLVGIDTQGRITHWNRAAFDHTGISEAQAFGRAAAILLPVVAMFEDQVIGAAERGEILRKERVTFSAGEAVRYADLMVYPLHDATAGAVVRIDDVTERVRMEEIMVQTEKMMSVGGLAAGMAHEINNPLGVIAQGCQNLQRRVSAEISGNRQVADEVGVELEQVREYLRRRGFFRFLDGMQEASARAAQIVGDMLAYSRRSDSSFELVHAQELFDTVLRLADHDYDLKKSYDFRRIRIERERSGESDEIYCDQMAIEQVLLNLVRNAAQAIAANPAHQQPLIRLCVIDDGDAVRMEVIDNGPGIDEHIARRLFEPFFTTKPVGVGTGLGLSVAYFIVTQQHRGKMWLETKPGKGAHFVVRLPRLAGK